MEHFISLKEQSKKDLLQILDLATDIKSRKDKKYLNVLDGKTMIMLFQKTSTRTRLSFESAMTGIGGHAIYLDSRTSQLSLTDFSDEIRAVMGFGDVLMFRALKASDVEKAASFNMVPVIDGCSEKYHPCQAMGDILTMVEYSKGLKNIHKVVWLGIENNVSNTLKLACSKLGINITIVSPEADKESIDKKLNKMSDKSGFVSYTKDIKEGLKEADYVHTDTWLNMEYFENGKIKEAFKKEFNRRKSLLMPYQLNAHIIKKYAKNAKIMHCMPCHVGYEITRDAIDSPNSIIFKQAENRMHVQKAIILWLLGKTR